MQQSTGCGSSAPWSFKMSQLLKRKKRKKSRWQDLSTSYVASADLQERCWLKYSVRCSWAAGKIWAGMYLVLRLLSRGIGLDCLCCLSLCAVSTEGKDEGSSKDPGSSRKAKRRMKHLIFGPDPTLNDRPTDHLWVWTVGGTAPRGSKMRSTLTIVPMQDDLLSSHKSKRRLLRK